MAKVDGRRGEGVRIKQPTKALLEEIRRRSIHHYGSFDELVRELAEQRLGLTASGIPRRARRRRNRGGATDARPGGRSSSSEAPRSASNLSGDAVA